MKNVKFWLVQIAMVAMVSLIFGSPVFADPGKGGEMKNAKAATVAQETANSSAGFVAEAPGGDTGGDGGATCNVDSPELCTSESECLDGGGAIWYNNECLF